VICTELILAKKFCFGANLFQINRPMDRNSESDRCGIQNGASCRFFLETGAMNSLRREQAAIYVKK
jgi:hypothetical protein